MKIDTLMSMNEELRIRVWELSSWLSGQYGSELEEEQAQVILGADVSELRGMFDDFQDRLGVPGELLANVLRAKFSGTQNKSMYND